MVTKRDGTKVTTKKAVWWDGDRLWRKTRSKTSAPLCYGADPNRNWDYDWCETYTTLRPLQFELQDDGSIQAINALTAVHGTQYQHDTIAQIIYATSGSTVDWTYGIANVTFSYGVELRDTGKYGFLLPENQIIPSGEETLAGLVALLQYIEKQVYA
ncbi:unnamed protein product [Rotaria sp. Silwood2]|nr:unnamed protein product [Rotaria sp. Silwood2]